ncbi:MAG: hypothetical protein Q4B26_12985 [Eubacteriales bacterium]|nr:hypothetical protein [Eubacteriales bacterium]
MPTDVTVGDNEIEQHRNFSVTHFSGVATCKFRLVGRDGSSVMDVIQMYVTRLGEAAKEAAYII